ncbi:hypothetical protein TNCV_1756201 [Trichonephila clavipes]|nr:hypothetical protein TNCV_1756201 [Trichonephila clavipes]
MFQGISDQTKLYAVQKQSSASLRIDQWIPTIEGNDSFVCNHYRRRLPPRKTHAYSDSFTRSTCTDDTSNPSTRSCANNPSDSFTRSTCADDTSNPSSRSTKQTTPQILLPDPPVVKTLEPTFTDDYSMDQILSSVFGDICDNRIPLTHAKKPQVLDTVPSCLTRFGFDRLPLSRRRVREMVDMVGRLGNASRRSCSGAWWSQPWKRVLEQHVQRSHELWPMECPLTSRSSTIYKAGHSPSNHSAV